MNKNRVLNYFVVNTFVHDGMAVNDFPIEDVVPWHGRGVGVTGVFDEQSLVRLQEFLGEGDAPVQVFLVGLVIVNAEHHVSSANESELRGFIVESSYLQHISDAIPIQS